MIGVVPGAQSATRAPIAEALRVRSASVCRSSNAWLAQRSRSTTLSGSSTLWNSSYYRCSRQPFSAPLAAACSPGCSGSGGHRFEDKHVACAGSFQVGVVRWPHLGKFRHAAGDFIVGGGAGSVAGSSTVDLDACPWVGEQVLRPAGGRLETEVLAGGDEVFAVAHVVDRDRSVLAAAPALRREQHRAHLGSAHRDPASGHADQCAVQPTGGVLDKQRKQAIVTGPPYQAGVQLTHRPAHPASGASPVRLLSGRTLAVNASFCAVCLLAGGAAA